MRRGQVLNIKNYRRRIHMDFHTPEMTEDFRIDNFNPVEYVRILEEAQVDSLVVFMKCHHGNRYYETSIGHKHKGLPLDVDMYDEISRECRKKGIKVIAYYSVGWLSPIQQEYPEWIERNRKGEMIGTSNTPKDGPWACICLNSPYLEEVIKPDLKDIFSKYEPDGLWFDIIENNPCYCTNCQKKYKELYGKDYKSLWQDMDNEDENYPQSIEVREFANRSKIDFVNQLVAYVRDLKPDLYITYNTAGRDLDLVETVDFCSVETHPGASWDPYGWVRGLLTYKYLGALKKPWESTTSRFIHGWGGWDDQPLENMQIVCSRILAHGGMINLGDQAYPDGSLDRELYERIGRVFSQIKEYEEAMTECEPASQIGLVVSDIDIYGPKNEAYFGAVNILTENQWPFDVIIDGYNLDDLSAYDCIILPELGDLSFETCKLIEKYVESGGTTIIAGNSSYVKDEGFRLSRIMGLNNVVPGKSKSNYLMVGPDLASGIRQSPLLIPGNVIECEFKRGQIHGTLVRPIIEPDYKSFKIFRNPEFSPPGKYTDLSLIHEHPFGRGKCISIMFDIFTSYQEEGQWYLADVFHNILENLVKPKTIRIEGSKSIEVNLTKTDVERTIHLIHYHLHKEGSLVRQLESAYDTKVMIPLNWVKNPDNPSIRMIPELKDYELIKADNQLELLIPSFQGYLQIITS